MDRRDFLVRGALGAGALALTRCVPPAPTTPLPPSTASWEAVRAQFDRAAPDQIHMASFFLVSHPRTVREAIEAHRRGLDDNPFAYVEDNVAAFEIAVRAAAAGYLGAQPDDLAMTDSTTQGLGLVYGGIDLRPGQEILTTTHDHIVTHLALAYRAARAGAAVRKVALYDEPAQATVDQIASRLAAAITPATRVIAVTWVHSGTGVKLPLRALADVVAHANAGRAEADRALLFVDGVHGFGNQDFEVAALGCDFLIAGCHKWLFGPRGTGLVWGRAASWPLIAPTIPSMDPMWRTGPPDRLPPAASLTPGGFHSFEHRWALPAAFELHQRIGKAAIAARIRELNTRCKAGLARLPRVRLHTPMDEALSAGLIAFEVDGLAPAAVVERLAGKRIIASVAPPFYVPTYARLAPSLLTLEADVDRTIEAVASL